ncbi:MAG TPA: hypothetical protein VII98_02395 [Solirubrobacteraceae bacterium]
MAEPRSTARKTAARKPAAKPAAAKKPAAARKPAAKKPAATTKPAAAAKKQAAKQPPAAKKAAPRVTPKPAERRSKRTAVARSPTEAARDVALFDNLGALGDLLAEHLVLTVERLQETLDDAVRRGRMLPDDAADIAQRLSQAGRRQVEELLAEAERRIRGLR